jgi:hypothetical protein
MVIEVHGNGRAEEIEEMESTEQVVLGNDSYITTPEPMNVDGSLYIGGTGTVKVIE